MDRIFFFDSDRLRCARRAAVRRLVVVEHRYLRAHQGPRHVRRHPANGYVFDRHQVVTWI